MQRALSDAEMEELLASESFGHLGCIEDGKPYVFPMAFVFHDNVLYGQTTEGKKIGIWRKNPEVCFQVQHLENRQWRSVICWGTFEELDFSELRGARDAKIVQLLTERIASIQDTAGVSIPFSFSGGAAPLTVNEKTSTLFRILVREKTGRASQ